MREDDALNADHGQGNKTGQVYGRLKSLIVLQKLPPRTPLEMKNIADRFGVSITPVREALILLANERLIAKNGNRSYLTRALDSREVQNDYEAALMIAEYCLRNGIHRFAATGLRLADRTSLIDWQAQDAAQAIALTIEALLERIAGLADNERMVRLMLEFNDRTSFVRQLDLKVDERLRETVDAMSELIETLETRNVDRAINNLQRQYQRKKEVIPALVREGNLFALEAIDIFNQ